MVLGEIAVFISERSWACFALCSRIISRALGSSSRSRGRVRVVSQCKSKHVDLAKIECLARATHLTFRGSGIEREEVDRFLCQSLPRLRSLRWIAAGSDLGVANMADLPDIAELAQLTELDVREMQTSRTRLTKYSSLTSLRLTICHVGQVLPPSLTSVRIQRVPRSLWPLLSLPLLKRLVVPGTSLFMDSVRVLACHCPLLAEFGVGKVLLVVGPQMCAWPRFPNLGVLQIGVSSSSLLGSHLGEFCQSTSLTSLHLRNLPLPAALECFNSSPFLTECSVMVELSSAVGRRWRGVRDGPAQEKGDAEGKVEAAPRKTPQLKWRLVLDGAILTAKGNLQGGALSALLESKSTLRELHLPAASPASVLMQFSCLETLVLTGRLGRGQTRRRRLARLEGLVRHHLPRLRRLYFVAPKEAEWSGVGPRLDHVMRTKASGYGKCRRLLSGTEAVLKQALF